jgi:hypothetical protein
MAAWILVAILGIILIFMIALYRRSVKEVNHLLTFTLFVLLDESTYRAQRDGLKRFYCEYECEQCGRSRD